MKFRHSFGSLNALHRIDKLTCGLLFLGKEFGDSMAFSKDLQSKIYLARVEGKFPEKEIKVEISLSASKKKSFHIEENGNGVMSITSFQIISFDEMSNTSLVHCKIKTGKTHQIRVHLQHIEFPIINDINYGGKSISAFPEIIQYFPNYQNLKNKEISFENRIYSFESHIMEICLCAWKYNYKGKEFQSEIPQWAFELIKI